MSQVPDVYILATCRRPELAPYTLLIFDSVRTGFPTAAIHVHFNRLDDELRKAIQGKADAGFSYADVDYCHSSWIERLIEEKSEPLFLLDTDLVFFRSFEGFSFDGSWLAGWRIPEFQDEFVGALTRARLHTSLLYIDPVLVREKLKTYKAQFPATGFNPLAMPCAPLTVPHEGRGVFYDCCSMLYHAIGGTNFTDEQKDAYFHFFFGTLPDLVLPRLSNGAEIGKARADILANPELGRGGWRFQEAYYANRQPVFEGKNVIAPVTPEDSALARKWNEELCCGNQAAMQFNDIYYGYVHGIDDLLDLMVDGRPTLSKDQILSIFFRAALLYTCPFFVANREFLMPIILDITHSYAVSVGWERAPQPHLRAMADVLRTSGNRLYWMVALLCGGEQHALSMIRKLHDSDWTRQHDAHGRPI